MSSPADPFRPPATPSRPVQADDGALVAQPPALRQNPSGRATRVPPRQAAPGVPGEVVRPPTSRRAPNGLPARATRPNVRSRSDVAGQTRSIATSSGLGNALGRGVRRASSALGAKSAGTAVPLRNTLEAVTRRRRNVEPKRTSRSIGVGRVLCWQLALVAVIAGLGAPKSIAAATVGGALAVVALTTVRIRGRLLYQWLGSSYRYLVRPHRALLEPGEEAAKDLVTLVADHGRVETVDIDGIPVAFIHQSDGIAAVLELHAARDTSDPGWRDLLSVSALLPPPDAASPPYTAQLILQTTPPADLNGLRGDFGLPTRQAWVTIQTLRTADMHDSADLSLGLSNAVQRTIRRLTRDDIPIRALDRDETLALVTALAQLDTTTDTATPVQVEETWSTWTAGNSVQACFRLDGWQDADASARQRILRRLDLIPSRGTTVAVSARRRDRRPDVAADCRMTVRITERDRARLENSASLLTFALDDLPEVRPERLDGDHLAALAASLPLGAGAI